jgi:2-polyprenyl-3-methyl-5-hydroxy-6-metoxy-1,4-benzoquinol methylase
MKSQLSKDSKHLTLNIDSYKSYLWNTLYKKLNKLLNNIKLNLPKTEDKLTVLDIGSGRGELLKIISETGHSVIGIDIDPECVQIGSLYSDCFLGKVDDLSVLFQQNQFDVIICSHVLEHLSNPYQALNLMYELEPKVVILAVPNLLRPIRILRALFNSRRGDHHEHLYSWGHAELIRLCEESGFSLISLETERVTINPFKGKIGYLLSIILSPVEINFLPKIVPMLGSSIILVLKKNPKS